MPAVYGLLQTYWRWYADTAPEPVTPLAGENITPTLANNTDIIRLRCEIVNANSPMSDSLKLQYSVDGSNFVDLGASGDWNYANGQGTNGDTIAGLTLTLADTAGYYHEDGIGFEVFANGSHVEFDFAIAPTVNIKTDKLYYFRIWATGVVFGYDTAVFGLSHPKVLTAGGGAGIFEPVQQDWRFYADDAPEPSTSLAGENLPPTLANNLDIIRLRATIAELGGTDGLGTISLEYSTDNFLWVSFGASGQWNYANGQGVGGNTIATLKLVDSDTKGKYIENNVTPQSITASKFTEIDVSLFPTVTVFENTLYYFRLRIAGNVIPLQLGATSPQLTTAPHVSFIPKQGNWKFFQDDTAEPTTALANENVQATLQNNINIIRCRITVLETGGKAGSGAVSLEYSTDNLIFTALGSLNAAWNYANGKATVGNQVTTNKLSDTANKMHYHEDAIDSESWVVLTGYEMDFAIAPTVYMAVSQVYYFRLRISGNAVILNSGKTHPSVLTLPAPAPSAPSSPGTPYTIPAYSTTPVSIVGDSQGNIYQMDSSENNNDVAISGYIETGDMVLGDGQFDKIISEVVPMLDAQSLTNTLMVQVGSRQSLNQDINWSLPVPFNIGVDIKCDFRKAGKYIRLRFSTNQINTPWALLGYKINYDIGSSR